MDCIVLIKVPVLGLYPPPHILILSGFTTHIAGETGAAPTLSGAIGACHEYVQTTQVRQPSATMIRVLMLDMFWTKAKGPSQAYLSAWVNQIGTKWRRAGYNPINNVFPGRSAGSPYAVSVIDATNMFYVPGIC